MLNRKPGPNKIAGFLDNRINTLHIDRLGQLQEDYMGALKKLTKQRDADAYIRMLYRAWEFSSHVHNENFDGMEGHLTKCNAFLSPVEGYLKIVAGNEQPTRLNR